MPHRSLARVIAPLALVAAAAAVALVIATSAAVTGGDDGAQTKTTTAAKPSQTPTRTTDGSKTTTTPQSTPRVYVVKPGDILSTIAERTGVSVAEILELNPDIDPQALVNGQRIKLRP